MKVDITDFTEKVQTVFKVRGKQALDALSDADRKAALESVGLISWYQVRVLAGDKTAEELLRREGKTLRSYAVVGGIALDQAAGDALKDVLGAAVGVAVALLAGLL